MILFDLGSEIIHAQQDNTATRSLADPGQVTSLWACVVPSMLSEGCKCKCLPGVRWECKWVESASYKILGKRGPVMTCGEFMFYQKELPIDFSSVVSEKEESSSWQLGVDLPSSSRKLGAARSPSGAIS